MNKNDTYIEQEILTIVNKFYESNISSFQAKGLGYQIIKFNSIIQRQGNSTILDIICNKQIEINATQLTYLMKTNDLNNIDDESLNTTSIKILNYNLILDNTKGHKKPNLNITDEHLCMIIDSTITSKATNAVFETFIWYPEQFNKFPLTMKVWDKIIKKLDLKNQA